MDDEFEFEFESWKKKRKKENVIVLAGMEAKCVF